MKGKRIKLALLALMVCIAMIMALVPGMAENESAEPAAVETVSEAPAADKAEAPEKTEQKGEEKDEEPEENSVSAAAASDEEEEPDSEPESEPEPEPAPQEEVKEEGQEEPAAKAGENADESGDDGEEESQEPAQEPAEEATEEPGEPAEGETEEPTAEPTEEPTTEPTEEPTEPQITVIAAFAPLEMTEYTMNSKPTLEDSLSRLPKTLAVKLNDGSEELKDGEVAVTWACPEYEDTLKYGTYTFTASLAEETYPLAEDVELPKFVLKVVPLVSGDYTYEINDKKEATLLGWTGSGKQLVVPEKFEEYTIVTIAAEAFKDKKELTRLELPKGIRTIGDAAFAGCVKLEAIVLTDALETLGADLFKDDAALKTVVLRTDLDSKLTAADTVEHTVTEGEGEEAATRTVTVSLPVAVTDLEVRTGTLTLDCDLTIESGHTALVDPEGTLKVNAERKLNALGALTNNGTLTNDGTVVVCGGEFTGAAIESADGASVITEHNFEDGECTYCGTLENTGKIALEIKYISGPLTKVYDKTRNVTLKSSDFKLSNIAEGDSVKITKLEASYDEPNVGNRTVKVKFTLGGDDGKKYTVKSMSISATITPKVLTVTPTAGQNKSYGAADPAYLSGKVKGLLTGDTLSGRLSREPGENVGKYRITAGTISGGDNYTVDVLEDYFTINAKPIDAPNVAFATIGNQRYTGSPVKPELDLRLGNLKLRAGRDYEAKYTDNVQTGTASVTVTGIGNFSGSRTANFRILRVSSGFSGTSSRSGGTSYSGYSYSGFDNTTDDEVDEPVVDEEEILPGELVIEDTNYGLVLFDGEGVPQLFTHYEEELEKDPEADAFDEQPVEMRVVIQPDPMVDEVTGETVYTADDRETYGDLHLRITPEQARMLMSDGFSELVYELEFAQLRVPLAELNGAFEIDQLAVNDETEEVENAEEMPEQDIGAAEGVKTVKVYDISIAQALEDQLTAREEMALEDTSRVQLAPAYRLKMVAEVAEDPESEITADWPALDQLKQVRLDIMVVEDYQEAPEDSAMTLVYADPEMTDEAAIQILPVGFINQDEILYADFAPFADGTYIVHGEMVEFEEEEE